MNALNGGGYAAFAICRLTRPKNNHCCYYTFYRLETLSDVVKQVSKLARRKSLAILSCNTYPEVLMVVQRKFSNSPQKGWSQTKKLDSVSLAPTTTIPSTSAAKTPLRRLLRYVQIS
jgi:hypothetical protein